jgi:hypothetical protein
MNWFERYQQMKNPEQENKEITLAEIFRKTPVMSSEKLLTTFAVDPDTPLLAGVLMILKGVEEIAKENAATCKLADSERAFYAGGIAVAGETQERIIELVNKGNAAKRGIKE